MEERGEEVQREGEERGKERVKRVRSSGGSEVGTSLYNC